MSVFYPREILGIKGNSYYDPSRFLFDSSGYELFIGSSELIIVNFLERVFVLLCVANLFGDYINNEDDGLEISS